MENTQNMNQFKPSVLAGMIALNAIEGRTIEAYVDSSYTGTGIQPGSVVALVESSEGLTINVTEKTAATTAALGVVAYSAKKTSYKAGDFLEVFINGKIVYGKIGAAVNAGASLSWDATNGYFVAATGSNPVDAIALDKVAANTIGRIVVKGIM